MAWTSPRTWVTAELVTAALLNTHLRDNMLQTGPAKVTTAGDILYATAANALARLGIGAAFTTLRTNSGATAPEWVLPGVRKTANEIVNNSAVLQNDNHISWAVGANEVWAFLLQTLHTTQAAAEIKFAWTIPAGASGRHIVVAPTHTAVDDLTAAQTITGARTNDLGLLLGFLAVGGTGGTAQLQWAQNIANASDTTLLANTCLWLLRLA